MTSSLRHFKAASRSIFSTVWLWLCITNHSKYHINHHNGSLSLPSTLWSTSAGCEVATTQQRHVDCKNTERVHAENSSMDDSARGRVIDLDLQDHLALFNAVSHSTLAS
jgi:hypothetical protein